MGQGSDTLMKMIPSRSRFVGIRGLRYYNPALHLASEALPNYLRDLLA